MGKEAQSLTIQSVGDPKIVSIHLVGVPTGDGVTVKYTTLPSNNPSTFGNTLYVWQTTSNIVPWNKAPQGHQVIGSDSSEATQKLDFVFENKGYIIGYAVAGTPKAVVSTIYLPAGKQNDPTAWEYDQLSLSVVAVDTNFLQVKYDGLSQYQAKDNENWLGLWQYTDRVPYAGSPIPSGKVAPVPTNAPVGYVSFPNGIILPIQTQFAVGYFMQKDPAGRTSLAASAPFSVGMG